MFDLEVKFFLYEKRKKKKKKENENGFKELLYFFLHIITGESQTKVAAGGKEEGKKGEGEDKNESFFLKWNIKE